MTEFTSAKDLYFKPLTYDEREGIIEELEEEPKLEDIGYDEDERESMREWEEDQGIHDDW